MFDSHKLLAEEDAMNVFDPSGERRRQHDRAERKGMLTDIAVVGVLVTFLYLAVEAWVMFK